MTLSPRSLKPVAAAFAAVVVSLTGALAPIHAAHGAAYTGTFDPQNPNYEWKGTHSFDISDVCLGTDGWRRANTEGGSSAYDQYGYAIEGSFVASGCTASLTGGSLDLRRKTGPDQAFKHLDFNQGEILPSDRIWGFQVKSGQLVGVDSYLIGGFRFSREDEAALDFDISTYGGFYLRWESGWAPADQVPESLFPWMADGSNQAYVPNFSDPAYLYVNNCGLGECVTREVTPGVAATNLTFTPLVVPEPGSLSLLLAALAGAFGARRRRR